MSLDLLNVRHLAAFAATVRHGTVTAAADAIALTQPALTQAIAHLEQRLDCRLFDREPAGMRPTAPALLLAPRAEHALALIGSPRVTSTQVRAFLALARKGSYAEAAEHIGVATASIHRAVADLSLALGERLVERRGRHVSLTRKGEARARSFGLAMAELRSGFAEVAEWQGQSGGRIVIGAMPLSRARWLPRAILAFARRRPGLPIAVIEGSYTELVGPLRDGDIDMLLGALRPDAQIPDLVQSPAFIDRPQIAMRRGHPLAGNGNIAPDDLARYPWVLPSSDTPLHAYWREMMTASERTPDVAIECGSVLTIRELLLETDMLTLLSPDQLRVEIEAGLHICAAPPRPIERTIGVTTRRDWRPTPAQREMLGLLAAEAENIS